MKKSVIIYYDYQETIWTDLTDEEVGQLVRALIKFDMTGEITEFTDRAVKCAYKRMVNDCANNREKWEIRAEKNRINGAKGGRPKTQSVNNETQQNPVGYSKTQDNPEKPVNVNVNVNDNVNANVNGNVIPLYEDKDGQLHTQEEADMNINRFINLRKLGLGHV